MLESLSERGAKVNYIIIIQMDHRHLDPPPQFHELAVHMATFPEMSHEIGIGWLTNPPLL